MEAPRALGVSFGTTKRGVLRGTPLPSTPPASSGDGWNDGRNEAFCGRTQDSSRVGIDNDPIRHQASEAGLRSIYRLLSSLTIVLLVLAALTFGMSAPDYHGSLVVMMFFSILGS